MDALNGVQGEYWKAVSLNYQLKDYEWSIIVGSVIHLEDYFALYQ